MASITTQPRTTTMTCQLPTSARHIPARPAPHRSTSACPAEEREQSPQAQAASWLTATCSTQDPWLPLERHRPMFKQPASDVHGAGTPRSGRAASMENRRRIPGPGLPCPRSVGLPLRRPLPISENRRGSSTPWKMVRELGASATKAVLVTAQQASSLGGGRQR